MRDDPTRRTFLLTTTLAGLRSRPPAWPPAKASCRRRPPATTDRPCAQSEGPFFKPRSPQRADLREPGMGGRVGRAVRRGADARLPAGGRRGGGSVARRRQGRLRRARLPLPRPRRHRCRRPLSVPHHRARRSIPGRTRHYHVKVQAAGRPVLTTQLYFPDEAGNRARRAVSPRAVDANGARRGRLAARFDFVLDIS